MSVYQPQSFVLYVDRARYSQEYVAESEDTYGYYVEIWVAGRWEARTSKTHGDGFIWSQDIALAEYVVSTDELKLNIMRERKFLNDLCIGTAEVDINTLLLKSQGTGDVVQLELRRKGKTKTRKCIGSVGAKLRLVNVFEAGKVSMDHALRLANEVQAPSTIVRTGNEFIADIDNVKQGYATFPNVCNNMVTKLEKLVPILDDIATIHPYINGAWKLASCWYKVFQDQMQRDKQLVTLVKTFDRLFESALGAEKIKFKQPSFQEVVLHILKYTIRFLSFITKYTEYGFFGRTVRQLYGEAAQVLVSMTDDVAILQESFNRTLSVTVATNVGEIREAVENQAHISALELLQSEGMDADTHPRCLPGTRTRVLRDVTAWLTRPIHNGHPQFASDDQNVIWLYGVLGCGKSTVAHTLKDIYKKKGQLAAFLLFDRHDTRTNEPAAFVRRLALELLCCLPLSKHAIETALRIEGDSRGSNLVEQFSALVLQPLKTTDWPADQGHVVVILDGLDECGEPHSRQDLLVVLSQSLAKLPSFFRVLITSRQDGDIDRCFRDSSNIREEEITIGDTEDISLYLTHELIRIRKENKLHADWPKPEHIHALIQHSAGLFIWASTVVKFIEQGRPVEERLDDLLQSNFEGESTDKLDELYSLALKAATKDATKKEKRRLQDVLGAVVVARVPLMDSALERLLDLPDGHLTENILPYLRPVLRWATRGNTVKVLHASFGEYLVDRDKCMDAPWFIDLVKHNNQLARAAFRTMKQLTFNICNLQSSYKSNDDVQDIRSRIQSSIPFELSYSSQFWADHMFSLPINEELIEGIDILLHEQFLFWLEVLSFVKNLRAAFTSMVTTIQWLGSGEETRDLRALAMDAKQFIAAFRKPMSQSSPHIYLSALPFAPKKSLIALHYRSQFEQTLKISDGALTEWRTYHTVLDGHVSPVICVAFSHDGKQVVSVSSNSTVYVWDVETGVIAHELSKGLYSGISCVTFSADSKKIIAGTHDDTVCVWDVRTGVITATGAKVHTGRVTSVACADSQGLGFFASGARDAAICLWDVESGQLIRGPLKRHEGSVTSVALSPNGKKIVSGSEDKTVIIWCAKTGNVLFGPLRKHTEIVLSVAFSWNSQHIVSGSGDRTVRVWDADTGQCLLRPLGGHTKKVTSVVFAADGKQILSGSDDRTIRIWDAATGLNVLSPFTGHTNSITSIALSKDGNHIVSGSEDMTVRVWDFEANTHRPQVVDEVKKSAPMTASLQNAQPTILYRTKASPNSQLDEGEVDSSSSHVNWITATDFWENESYGRVASGSRNGAIHVWNPNSGAVEVGPLTGHKACVTSIAFSCDGTRIVSGSYDRSILVWDAFAGTVVIGPLLGHVDNVTSVAFSRDGKQVASGSSDKTILVWSTQTGDILLGPINGHLDRVNSISFSYDMKQLVSGSADKTICLWDTNTGDLALGPLRGHSDWVNCVRFAEDGELLISASHDGTIRVWSVQTGDLVLGPLVGHVDAVTSLAVSESRGILASGSCDNGVIIWDLKTGRIMLGPLHGHSGWITSVAFSKDGGQVISGSHDCTVRLWDVGARKQTTILDEATLDQGSGWMVGKNGELLFWVPPNYRDSIGLPLLRNTLVIPVGSAPLLSYEQFVQGSDWTRCRNSN